jgi:hypothetical protein
MLPFLKKHIVGGIGIFVGSAISVGSLVLHAYALHEMGLPLEIWVAIGLGIFILSVVGILYKWWDEIQRVSVRQGQVTRLETAELARIEAVPSNVELSPTSPNQLFIPEDIYFHHDTTTPNLGYRHKLWIVLRNQGGRDIIVNPANWERTSGDLPDLPLARHPWTPEGPGGWENNSWVWPRREREMNPIHVARGGVIQTYVPLPGSLDKIELRRRTVSKRLGTLIIPFTVDGENRTETHKL